MKRKSFAAYLTIAAIAVRTAVVEADSQPAVASASAAPATSVEGLPDYVPALQFMQTAQEIWVFPNTNPRFPHRDDKQMRLLDAKARAELLGVIDTKEDWRQGLYEIGVADKPPTDVGFIFKTGKNELVLFFMDHSLADGILNGQPFKGLLNEDSSHKLKEWAAKYSQTELAVPAETPPPQHRPDNFEMVDGQMVTGEFAQVSDSDVRGAVAAFLGAGLRDTHFLDAVGKDEIRDYLDSNEWMAASRMDCGGRPVCWQVPRITLPTYKDAMRCIMEAKYAHVFPVADPLKHGRDFDRSEMLDDPVRRELVGLLGSADSWSQAPDTTMPAPGQLPASFGFEIGDGRNWVRLFFSTDGKVQGDFNGEYFTGTLDKTAAQELQAWKAKYIKSWVVGADHA